MRWKAPLAALALTVCTAVPALAHHSFGMFDLQKNMTFVGTVVEYNWENPHCHILVDVPPSATDKSTIGKWDLEGGAVNIMTRQGWNRATYKPGDKITIVAHPMKDGSKGASIYYAVLPNGQKLGMDVARPAAS